MEASNRIALPLRFRVRNPNENRRAFRPVRDVNSDSASHLATAMAMALHFEQLLHDQVFKRYVEIANTFGISNVHIHRIMSLTFLSPDIQEALLFLVQDASGKDPIGWRDILQVSKEPDWTLQRHHPVSIRLKTYLKSQ